MCPTVAAHSRPVATPPTVLQEFVVNNSIQMIEIRTQCRTHARICTSRVRHVHNNPHHLWVFVLFNKYAQFKVCIHQSVDYDIVRRHKLNTTL